MDAYQALIEATVSLATGEDRRDARRELIAAKQRVLYFAPTDVVHALAEFSRTSQVFPNPDAVAAFARMLKAMRASRDLPPIEDRDLLRVFVGEDELLAASTPRNVQAGS